MLGEDDREALAEHLGCSPDLLRHDRRLTRRTRPKPTPPSPYAAPRGYSAVPEIDVRASAGPGAWNDEFEEAKDTWLFADPLIRHEFRAKPEDLRMITVDGDSMEPLLSSGDRILIDVSRKVPVPPGIFVIWDGMGLVAKRIEHVPHSEPPKVVLKSLNPEYDSYERPCRGDPRHRTGRLGLQTAVAVVFEAVTHVSGSPENGLGGAPHEAHGRRSDLPDHPASPSCPGRGEDQALDPAGRADGAPRESTKRSRHPDRVV